MNLFVLAAVAVILGGIAFTFARRILFSLAMAAIIAAVFAIEVLDSPYVISSLVLDLAFQPVHLDTPTSLYTLFTSMFLHASFMHLIFNMIALIFIGPLLEERIGTPRFAVIYIISGIIGTLAFSLMHLNEVAIVLGASGAISGILGAFAILYPREKIAMLPLPPIRLPFLVAIIILVETLLALDPRSHIAHEAHLMGLAAGVFLGPLIMKVGARADSGTLAGLERLAVDDELRMILQKVEGESVEDVRRAWLEKFMQKARCPECGGTVRMKGRRVYSDCGWSMKLERKE
ncbi:MAG: rhomboid family intramembrane serine protease [Thermoplasmata archaeon]